MMVADELECDWSKVKAEFASANRNLHERPRLRQGHVLGRQPLGQGFAHPACSRWARRPACGWSWPRPSAGSVPAAECEAKRQQGSRTSRTGRTLGYGALAAGRRQGHARQGARRSRRPTSTRSSASPSRGSTCRSRSTARRPTASTPRCRAWSMPRCWPARCRAASSRASMMRPPRPCAASRRWCKLDGRRRGGGRPVLARQAGRRALKIEWDGGDAGASTDSAHVRQANIATRSTARPSPRATTATSTRRWPASGKRIEARLRGALSRARDDGAAERHRRITRPTGSTSGSARRTRWRRCRPRRRSSGLKPEQVFVHNCFFGGGFGRRGVNDEMVQAIQVSKAIGKPVKLVWTREEDIRHDRYRPQAAVRLKALLGRRQHAGRRGTSAPRWARCCARSA